MAYQVGNGIWGQVFAVPAEVADSHLKLASGLAVKVLQLILRHNGAIDTEEIASRLGQSPSDIRDAVCYWTECGVLGVASAASPAAEAAAEPASEAQSSFGKVQLTPALEYEEIARQEEASAPAVPVAAPAAAPAIRAAEQPPADAPRRVSTLSSGRRRFATHEINEMAAQDENITYLLQETQSVLGKTLTPVVTDTVVALYSYHGMQPDLILMLIQYCYSIGKSSMRYVEKVASDWLNRGIDSHEKAEAEILHQTRKRSAEGQIKSAFGIYDRSLVTSEQRYIQTWIEEYGQSLPLITLAYERSVEMKGKLSFAYINGILTNWHKQGITTTARAMQEIRENRPKPESKQREKGSSYDLGEMEALISNGDLV